VTLSSAVVRQLVASSLATRAVGPRQSGSTAGRRNPANYSVSYDKRLRDRDVGIIESVRRDRCGGDISYSVYICACVCNGDSWCYTAYACSGATKAMSLHADDDGKSRYDTLLLKLRAVCDGGEVSEMLSDVKCWLDGYYFIVRKFPIFEYIDSL